MKPYLKNIRSGAVERAVRRRLAEADLPALLDTQRAAVEALADASLYVPAEREDFERALAGGEIWGVFAGERLVAASALLLPGAGDGLDCDLGLAAGTAAELNCYFVAPEYRKNGLGGELARFTRRRAFALGAPCLAATVSPRNVASISALVGEGGLRIRCARLKYGGKLRYIALAKRFDDEIFTVFERFAIEDVYGITRMLARGYAGCSVYRGEDGTFLWVAK